MLCPGRVRLIAREVEDPATLAPPDNVASAWILGISAFGSR